MKKIIKYKMCEVLNVGTGSSITINRLIDSLTNIIKVKPKKIFKKLPKGDPEISDGTFNKLKSILDINNKDFSKFDEALKSTINYFKNYK